MLEYSVSNRRKINAYDLKRTHTCICTYVITHMPSTKMKVLYLRTAYIIFKANSDVVLNACEQCQARLLLVAIRLWIKKEHTLLHMPPTR